VKVSAGLPVGVAALLSRAPGRGARSRPASSTAGGGGLRRGHPPVLDYAEPYDSL